MGRIYGEQMDGMAVPVVNERAVRAAAGMWFAWALVAFMYAWTQGNFVPQRIFVLVFLFDMAIRVLGQPKWSPSMVLAQWMVRKQQPEWTGAAQKRFAWGIGLVLALFMTWLMVINNVIGPINVLVCGICLTLMFYEAAFGVCLGCVVYGKLKPDNLQMCPGGVCDMGPDPRAQVRGAQWLMLLAGVAVLAAAVVYRKQHPQPTMHHVMPGHTSSGGAPSEAERCVVPAFAKAMGHEDMWKKHNNCE